MGNVVRLHARKPETASEAFLAAWAAFPDTGRLRSSKRVAWPQWLATLADVDEETLMLAVQRYAREDKDHRKECGAPAFDRWLKWGRWEHWLPKAEVVQLARIFPDPELRASFAARFEEKALVWLDRCGWDQALGEISSPTRAVKPDWIKGPFNRWAKEQGVKALVFQ